MKKRIAVIGAGISGLTIARLLRDDFDVTVFERQSSPGGLIKCNRVNGNLYHMVGGHVFNSKRDDVLGFFWDHFDRDLEFNKADRNAAIYFGNFVNYPIENNLHQLGISIVENVIGDLIEIEKSSPIEPSNFEEFLLQRFGETLYGLYFKPYNEKIWKVDLKKVPLSWLGGKLPMPTVKEIIINNVTSSPEKEMVHSTFFYPRIGGSQFIVDRFCEGIDIKCSSSVSSMKWIEESEQWRIGGKANYDSVVFSGNLKSLPSLLQDASLLGQDLSWIELLPYHGTTTALCSVDPNPYSWIYFPDPEVAAHRMINTGNFADSNNSVGVKSATVEFTGRVSRGEIEKTLSRLPFNPKYIDHEFTKFTYPIQEHTTRAFVQNLKDSLEGKSFYITGRFAEWEYYNIDAAIGASLDLYSRVFAPKK